jgi:murein DD-endopeptidase MepM/ murein hydrolase activator NlpD
MDTWKLLKAWLKKKHNKTKRENTSEKTEVLRTVTTSIGTFMLSFVGMNSIVLILLFIGVVGIVAVIVLVVGAITGSINDGLNTIPIPTNVTQTAGAQYVWNTADLNKMPDAWSKNLYRLGWLIDTNKQEQNSDISTALMMGLPVSETGSNFFPTGTDHGLGVIDGTGKQWNTYSIADYATVGGDFPYTTDYDYITGLYAVDASYMQTVIQNGELIGTWGAQPHATTLSTETIGTRHESYINVYADGDVMQSVYNPAVAVGYTIYMYEQYENTFFNEIADYGTAHKYGEYWEKVAAKYDISVNDLVAKKNIYNMLYYWVHAGGVWSYTDIADDFNEMALDYAAYVYTQIMGNNINNIRLQESYSKSANVRIIGTNILRAAVRGDNNIDHANATVWNDAEYTAGTTYLEYKSIKGWTTIEKPIEAMWEKHKQTNDKADGERLINTYAKTYLHSNKNLVRQANYAVSTGVSTIAAGNARLKYIFDILGIEYTLNTEGYVCYLSGGTGGTNAVPNGTVGKDFESTKGLKYDGYSNYRDPTWFATINNAEWVNPLSANQNGGFSVSSRYGYRYLDSAHPWDWHSGFDLVYNQRSTDLNVLRKQYPVYAMHDGVITKVNTNIDSSAGRYIHYKVTYQRNGVTVSNYITYMHLSAIADNVVNGATIKAGQVIGYMGGSGYGSELYYGVHLHISMSQNASVQGVIGRIDVETELPFVTQYAGYTKWFETGASGYLAQKPYYDTTQTGMQADPQIQK